MNYYPHHLGDYAKDTGHLSLAEHGAYRMLLDHYYATETPLPGDVEKLCRICRAVTKIERAAVESVVREFFTMEDGAYRHNRVERELCKLQAQREKSALNGQRGGRPKKTQRVISGFENENPAETQRVISGFDLGNPEGTLTNNQEPITNNQTVLLEKEPKGGPPAAPPGKGSKSSSLEQARRLAEEANAVAMPLSLPPMAGYADFAKAWGEWCEYRTERATVPLVSNRLPWTARAAKNALLEIERVAAGMGLDLVTQRIRQAMAGSWQGLNLERMTFSRPGTAKPASPSFNIQHQHDSI